MTASAPNVGSSDYTTFDSITCNLKVPSFTGTRTTINPMSGGSVTLTGAITDTSGQPVNWQITVAGQTFTGIGNTPSAVWDGKNSDGTVAKAGETVTATLTAWTEGACKKTKDLAITVKEDKESCSLIVDFGSTANVASGNLNHSQTVCTVPNSKGLGELAIAYNSLDGYLGVLGRGWTHTYNVNLIPNNDGSYSVMEGDGSRTVLYQNGSLYTPKTSAYPSLAKNADNTYTLTYKEGTVYSFASNGKITGIQDRNANTTAFTYDATGNLVNITDPSGKAITLSYDPSGRINTVADPGGNTHRFTYNGNTLVTVSTTTPQNVTTNWNYTYDPNGFMLSKTDPLGNTTTYTYDTAHRVLSSTDPEGKTKTVTYPTGTGDIKTTAVTEKDGGVWTYQYDTTKGLLNEKTDPQGGKTTYTYDTKGNKLTETDPAGGVTAYTYDADGNMTSVKDALNNTTSYTYNSYGQVTGITDPQGKVTQYTYDSRGNLTSTTDPSGAVTRYQYDPKGNITSITNASNQTTAFTYDSSNNIASITDPAGSTTSFTYDSAGNMASQTDTAGNTTRFAYNSLNQLIKVTDPPGKVTEYTYDAKGNRTGVKDANGNITAYEYNYKGRITKVKDALGNITTYTYGSASCPSCGGGVDKLTSITDAGGNTTGYAYDTSGRLIKETDPRGNAITYAYDPSGNLISKTDATGITITYSYDPLKRLTAIRFPDPAQNITYAYDPSGKVLSMTDPSGTTAYTYDTSGRLTAETRQINGNNYTTAYAYTATGALSSITYPGGRVVSYNQDAAGRVMSVSETKDGVTKDIISGITYNQNGTVANIIYGNGIETIKGYDKNNALSSLKIGNLKYLSYTRDNIGNITSIVDMLDPAKTKTFTYDALSRLTGATLGTVPDLPAKQGGAVESGLSPYSISYAYDPVGNRAAETNKDGTTGYTYSANQLTYSSGAKPFVFSYDKNGNTIAERSTLDPERSFIYNQNQRLIKAMENTRVLGEYLYNGSGQRVKKTAGGKTAYFIYDQSGNLLEEIDGQGKAAADYIYLGAAPVARMDMNRDILPPVTTAAIGAPFYQSGSTTYISASTPVTLSAIDEGNPPSGVDYTEYKTDSDAWARYANPFTLVGKADGMHTIGYRSVDKAGNIEDTKANTVYLDTIAPQSAIGAGIPYYQAGSSIYISGSTPITITAADSGSGVAATEYSIDSGAYSPYTAAFTLAALPDGSHTISYRSVDNVANKEADKTATFIVDKTPPVTTITASDPLIQGAVNTVTPNTRFSLSATDALSGVKAIYYRIDQGGWSSYTGAFIITSAGPHSIEYKSVDNLGNEETAKALQVKVIVIDVSKTVSIEPIVLAGGWDQEHKVQSAINNLTAILSSSGLSYYIPQSEEEFKEHLRAGRYNTYLILDLEEGHLTEELRSAVHYGDGLLYIKTNPENDDEHKTLDIFGARFNGMSANRNLPVSLTESDISHAGILQSQGKAVRTTITSPTAKSLGYVVDKRTTYPVIITNQYGRGRVILFTFDLLNSPDQGKVKDLIVHSINYVAPKEHYTHALSDAPINITLANSTEPADIWVTETVPVTTTVDGIIPEVKPTGNTIPWQLSLAANEKRKLGYWLNLPDAAGDYLTSTSINYNNLGNYRLYGNYALNLNVALSSADLLRGIITDIQNLIPSTKRDLEKIQEATEELNKIDQNAASRREAKKNIERILEAQEELSKTTFDTSAIRLKLDELLKIWQKKWSLMPVEIEKDDDDKDKDEHEKDKKHSMLDKLILPYETERKPILIAATGPLTGILNATKSNDVLYFYHTDHLGTPIMMTDSKGNKVWEAEYTPFGEVYSITGTVDNNLRFPGQYFDQETGLYQNNRRDYRPKIGRYLEKDPIGFKGGINLYSYPNNPINNADPMGLKEAGYGGWEVQAILGYGEATVSCCDGQKLHQLKYKKVCFGAGFTAGISSGAAAGSQGASCKNPPAYVIGGEFGIPLFGPVGIEGGVGGATSGGYSAFGGATAGLGGKATVCIYWLVSNTEKGCCKQ